MAQMKGMVLSSGDGRAVILTPEGEYRSIKVNRPLEVGELYDGMAGRPWWRYALAAAIILAMTMGTIDFFSVKAYAMVSDSVELGLNRWGRVVSTRALNEEGVQILANSNLKGKKIEAAVEEIADKYEAEVNNGKDHAVKYFPVQAIDKGNRPEGFLERVEGNKNQNLERYEDRTNGAAGTQESNNSGNNPEDNHNSNSQPNSSGNSEKIKEKVNGSGKGSAVD